MKTYTHPQEKWTNTDCEKRSKYAPGDRWGNKPPKGIIAGSSSTRPGYGQTVRYNGGFTAPDGQWYAAESRPLPLIPDGWEFHCLPTWGTTIRKRGA